MFRILGKPKRLLTALGITLAAGAAACYPGQISDITETELIFTFYEPDADFAAIATYAMPDSIVRVGVGEEDDIDRTYDAQILAEIASQLNALGYSRIDENNPTPPDFIVLVAVNSTSFSYWVPGGWWGWWGWYPGWGGWYPGWGPPYYPGYPWYPGYGGTYSTGTLAVTMLEPISIGMEIPAIWAGLANGLLSSTSSATAARALDAVDQMFEQSPYLGR